MNRALALAAALLAAGCVSQSDINKPVQEQLAVTGRIMGFALDARTEALETKLALLEADPKLEAALHCTAADVRKELDDVKGEKRSLEAELKALKDRYPADTDSGNP